LFCAVHLNCVLPGTSFYLQWVLVNAPRRSGFLRNPSQ
jgi:hypothetical protein